MPSPYEFTERPALPARDVTAATLEDAYVRFILHCNPALPLKSDTESLREAFRNPPRSGGKEFDPFRIYELVKQFYDKEIKTWAELTTKLGVDPPDPSKDESTQKIAQYGVRLKKWLNSMHIKSFFEYLMDIPNDYWTRIPREPDPTALPMRDGVALEDDMVLRALLPHLRPKRGRKRPGGDDNVQSPLQKRRASPTSTVDEQGLGFPGPRSAQTMQPEYSLFADSSRLNPATWGAGDSAQTPLTRWPQSAITPSTRRGFWDDTSEPRSAISPPRPKLSSHRRGAKNVSSAWKPGGVDGAGKTRGRPPINRTPTEDSRNDSGWYLPAVSSIQRDPETPHDHQPMATNSARNNGTNDLYTVDHVTPLPAIGGIQQPPLTHDLPRPARPNISLKVPERQGGSVRLATPPPVLLVSGYPYGTGQQHIGTINNQNASIGKSLPGVPGEMFALGSNQNWVGSGSTEVTDNYFEKMEDRTNVDALVAFFIQEAHEAEWFDGNGKPAETGSMEECTAIVNAVLETVYATATSMQSFFFNLAALAGARALMNARAKVTRILEDEANYMYKVQWEYQFGELKDKFDIAQRVPRKRWEKQPHMPTVGDMTRNGNGNGASVETLSTEHWHRKYQLLAEQMEKRERELAELRTKLMWSLK